uniref:Uncharacterized protein n=1 Tax=Glossina palpalis gambiensis TaxID=67801 RepID=A0A1B0BWD9_9MUSC
MLWYSLTISPISRYRRLLNIFPSIFTSASASSSASSSSSSSSSSSLSSLSSPSSSSSDLVAFEI